MVILVREDETHNNIKEHRVAATDHSNPEELLHSALDLLQTMSEVQKCWVRSTFLVVSKDDSAVIVHPLPNKAIKTKHK